MARLALAGLAALSALAAARDIPNSDGSFKLPLTRRATKSFSEGDMYNLGDAQYWGVDVSFGGQSFSLTIDTGSSDIWVLSTEMDMGNRTYFPSNHFLDPSKSKTFKLVDGATYNISYDAGEIFSAGKVGTDVITIGNASVNMPFGLATQVSRTSMLEPTYDGVLGLAFGTGNTQSPKPGPTFMEALQSQLDQPVFTLSLPNSPTGQNIEFGRVDHSLYNGTLKTIQINNSSQGSDGWMASGSLSVGGKNISSQMIDILFDSGGLSGAADPDTVAAYWKLVDGSQDTSAASDGTGWAFPCSGSPLPDLTYDFVGADGKTVSATVPGKFFNSTQSVSSNQNMCSGAFQSWGNGGTFGFIGYAFFHSFFTVFDQSVPNISIAPYPQQELDGHALSAPASTATGSSAAGATSDGAKVRPTATDTTRTTSAAAGGAVSATAAPTGASDSAPGGGSKSLANGLGVPMLAMFFAVVGSTLLV